MSQYSIVVTNCVVHTLCLLSNISLCAVYAAPKSMKAICFRIISCVFAVILLLAQAYNFSMIRLIILFNHASSDSVREQCCCLIRPL